MKLTRKYLFEAVWEFPRKTLAERWDLSANTITTGCKISQIPLPPPGYWTQREMGKPPQRPQLVGPEDELIELTDPPKRKPVQDRRPEHPRIQNHKEKKLPASTGSTQSSTREIEERRTCKSIDEALPIIRKAYRSYSSPRAFRDFRYKHVLPASDNTIRMTVMPELVERALLILNAFLRGCYDRKWTIQIPAANDRNKNSVEVDGIPILFSIMEQRRQEKIKSQNSWSEWDYTYHSTGILRFQYSSSPPIWQEIKDRKHSGLEDRIDEIIQAIESEVERAKKAEKARQENLRLSRLRDKLSRLIETVLAHNQACDERLDHYLEQFKKAQSIRRLANAFRQNIPPEELQTHHVDWIKWLGSRADQQDPTTNLSAVDFTLPLDIKSRVKEMIAEDPEQYGVLQELDLDTSIENTLRWLASTRVNHHW
ncbi:hypothetical protein [Marinobacter segnicrescens]|uniref:hypothetical protein n=1 Tax=Marinobacter segnicrescens TaxID=430453 RepID=UPI003A95D915